MITSLQEGMGAGHRAHLRAARRPRARRPLGDLRSSAIPASPWRPSALTFGTLFVLLLAYKSGLIKVTQKFRLGVVAATGGIFLFYMPRCFSASSTSPSSRPSTATALIGIGFSLVVVAIAALNLVLDFDFVEQGVAYGAPKYMEWYAAFGIMVTLVWLYIEMLRLLAKMRSR